MRELDVLRSYRELKAWQLAMTLVADVHVACRGLRRAEQRATVNQLRRAVVSVPSNIAEGYGRQHRREYVQFLSIALGSLYEVETQLLLARAIAATNDERLDRALARTEQVSKLTLALRSSLTRAEPRHPNPDRTGRSPLAPDGTSEAAKGG